MLQFSPKNSNLWQVAAFSLVYSSIFGVIIRLGILFGLFLTIILLTTNGSQNLPLFMFSLLGTFLMFEAFYSFKVLRTKPALKGSEISEKTNLADLVSLDLARALLLHSNWSTTSALVKGLYTNRKVKFVFNKAGISTEDLKQTLEINETVNIASLLQEALAFAEKDNVYHIDSLSLLAAIFANSKAFEKLLFDKELKFEDLVNIIHWGRIFYHEKEGSIPFWEKPTTSLGIGMASVWSGGWTIETEKFTKDISSEILGKEGQYLVGRKKEISEVENVLSRSERRNVILLGQPGLGKNTIVYSLAAKSVRGELPDSLRFKRFLELDVTSVIASANTNEIEQRVKNILVEISHAGNVVLFIPEIENLAGALENGKLDISGLLVNSLQDIDLQIIGTSNRAAFHQFIESKPAFANDFEVIDVTEPTSEEAIQILEEVAIKIEQKNSCIVTYPAIKTAVELSERYLVDRVLPGKAIDILDESSSAKSLIGKGLLTKIDVEKVISDKTNIPVNLARGDEKEKLLKLSKTLHQRIIGQDEAVDSISLAIQRSRTLKRESNRPNGVFLFLGPTGVGKTETAKALAEVYYGSEERIIRFDMSEFNQETAVFRLIGSPPGSSEYKEGGQLTEAVRVNPFSLILLDELEKSHHKVLELFLAIFDEGRISDSSGRLISFTNTIIIGTSNAGAEFIRENIQKNTPAETVKKTLTEKLLQEGTFKPEFLNRFDSVVVYKPLNQNEVEQVVSLMIMKLLKRLQKQDLTIAVAPEVVTYLAKKGYDPQFGARPLQRALQDQLEGLISKALLEGKLNRGSKASVILVNNTLQLS